MTESTLTRILRVSQQISYQFYDINCDLSKTWHTLELAQGNLKSLMVLYDEWLQEKGLEQKHSSEQQ